MESEKLGKASGGLARAAKLSPEERREIARQAALARWHVADGEMPEALREGSLPLGDVMLDCYTLKDRRRVFHKRGLAKTLGMKSAGGNVFLRTFFNTKGIGSLVTEKLREKLANPIEFKTLRGDLAHGYEATTLIDICEVIMEAKKHAKLTIRQHFLTVQAEIILRASAKIGIIALFDEATGFIKDKRKEEYRELFKIFIREDCREYEREFPNQFPDMIYRLYNLKRNPIHKNRHPQFFAKFTRKYIYAPLVNSNGAILELLDEKNPIVYKSGGRKYKLFQFLNDLGLPALRAQIWQVIGIGNGTRTKEGFQKAFGIAFPQPGEQGELFGDDI
jgi:hypothetical protein